MIRNSIVGLSNRENCCTKFNKSQMIKSISSARVEAATLRVYLHCVESVQIRSYIWSVFSCIRTEYGDLRSNFETGAMKSIFFFFEFFRILRMAHVDICFFFFFFLLEGETQIFPVF